MKNGILALVEEWRTKLATEPGNDSLSLIVDRHGYGMKSADLLSEIHERSVGKVRKSNGVYYTPNYIVQYIVGKLFGCLPTAKSRDGSARSSNFTILDPACGCGAFLLGVYQYLLDCHLREYVDHAASRPARREKITLCLGPDGQWRLPLIERRRILLDSIYGVDLDSRAVEITRISLLLKMLEGETADSLNELSRESGALALPDLSHNIRCGNSLVGHDLFQSNVGKAIPPDDRAIINAFDWQHAFPAIFGAGGFHVVIGNPPYLNGIEQQTRFGDILNQYFRARYASASGAIDASILFQELSLNLLRPGGVTSMIVPNKFLSAPYGAAYRTLVTKSAEIRLLADFTKADVFKGVAAYPIVYVLEKISPPRDRYPIELETHVAGDQACTPSQQTSVDVSPGKLATWSRIFSRGHGILDRLARDCVPLGDLYEVAASATAAEAYAIKEFLRDEKSDTVNFRFVTSGSIDRYVHRHGFAPMRYLKSTYQHPYLEAHCQCLSKNRQRQYFSEKLIFAGMTQRLEAIWDDGQLAGSVPTVQVLTTAASPYSLKFVLGIMNSNLINWVFNQYFASLALSGGYLRIGVPQIRTLPLPNLDLSNMADKNRHDELVSLVETMILFQSRRMSVTNLQEQKSLDCQVSALDRAIDDMTDELFKITTAERTLLTK